MLASPRESQDQATTLSLPRHTGYLNCARIRRKRMVRLGHAGSQQQQVRNLSLHVGNKYDSLLQSIATATATAKGAD